MLPPYHHRCGKKGKEGQGENRGKGAGGGRGRVKTAWWVVEKGHTHHKCRDGAGAGERGKEVHMMVSD